MRKNQSSSVKYSREHHHNYRFPNTFMVDTFVLFFETQNKYGFEKDLFRVYNNRLDNIVIDVTRKRQNLRIFFVFYRGTLHVL